MGGFPVGCKTFCSLFSCEETKTQVNKTYAFLSSSLTFWIPVLIMISLYYRFFLIICMFFK